MNFPVHTQVVKLVILLFFGIPNLDLAKHTKSNKQINKEMVFFFCIQSRENPTQILINEIYQH